MKKTKVASITLLFVVLVKELTHVDSLNIKITFDLEQKLKVLKEKASLVESPNGYQFERDPTRGPDSTRALSTKICIIGAGPAGIHMASQLKKRFNFQNVTIFEQHSRIGGNAWSIPHRGVHHEMGPSLFTPDSLVLKNLASEYNAGPILPSGEASIWVNNELALDLPAYTMYEYIKELKLQEPPNQPVFLEKLLSDAESYVSMHMDYFGVYPFGLMNRPEPETWWDMPSDFKSFLQGNGMETLIGVFKYLITARGYGSLDEISPIYVFMYVRPHHFYKVIHHIFYPSTPTSFVFENGFEQLFEKMVLQDELDVKTNRRVVSYERLHKTVRITHVDSSTESNTESTVTEICDFGIIASGMLDVENSIMKMSSVEKNIFSGLKKKHLTVSLIDSNYGRRPSRPTSYFMNNLDTKLSSMPFSTTDSFAIINNIRGENYTSGRFPGGNDRLNKQTTVVCQLSSTKPIRTDANNKLNMFTSEYGYTNATKLIDHTFSFFPKFSHKRLSTYKGNNLWDLADIQGIHRTWIIGAHGSFESVNSVLDYNNLLLWRYLP